MARILIHHDRDPLFAIEVFEPDPTEGDWSGICPRCPWSVAQAFGQRGVNLGDAVRETLVHLDHQHPEV